MDDNIILNFASSVDAPGNGLGSRKFPKEGHRKRQRKKSRQTLINVPRTISSKRNIKDSNVATLLPNALTSLSSVNDDAIRRKRPLSNQQSTATNANKKDVVDRLAGLPYAKNQRSKSNIVSSLF